MSDTWKAWFDEFQITALSNWNTYQRQYLDHQKVNA